MSQFLNTQIHMSYLKPQHSWLALVLSVALTHAMAADAPVGARAAKGRAVRAAAPLVPLPPLNLAELPQLQGGAALENVPWVSDLKEALKATFEDNPELAFERSRLEQSRQQLGMAQSEWMPRLFLTHNRNGWKEVHTNSDTTTRQHYTYRYNDYALELRQNLFSGFATQARVNRAQLQLQADELRLTQKVQAKALEVVSAYAELRRVRLNFAHVRDARNQTAALLSKVRAKGTAGLVAPVEVQRVESRFLAIENQLFDQYRLVQVAETSFFELVRRRPQGQLNAMVPYLGYGISDLKALSLGDLEQQARQHPLRLQAELISQMREEDRREAWSAYFPQLEAVLRRGQGHNVNGYTDVPGNDQRDSSAHLEMRWTLFDGLGTQKRVDAAGYAKEAAYHAVQDVSARVDKRVQDAWNELNLAAARLETARAGSHAAAMTANNYEELVLSGRRTLVEGVNVIEELMRARVELNNQEHFAVLAGYKLAVEVGDFNAAEVFEDLSVNVGRIEK